MRIHKNEHVAPFDVDGTLILPLTAENAMHGRKVQVWDSISKKYISMVAHEPNIRLLIEEKHRGSLVIVWSRGGYEWAANVIRALDLVSHVDDVYSKPLAYFDDLDISEWLKYRVYLSPETRYKR